jgi:hypothetical protein
MFTKLAKVEEKFECETATLNVNKITKGRHPHPANLFALTANLDFQFQWQI